MAYPSDPRSKTPHGLPHALVIEPQLPPYIPSTAGVPSHFLLNLQAIVQGTFQPALIPHPAQSPVGELGKEKPGANGLTTHLPPGSPRTARLPVRLKRDSVCDPARSLNSHFEP